jgi:hypothetical protein
MPLRAIPDSAACVVAKPFTEGPRKTIYAIPSAGTSPPDRFTDIFRMDKTLLICILAYPVYSLAAGLGLTLYYKFIRKAKAPLGAWLLLLVFPALGLGNMVFESGKRKGTFLTGNRWSYIFRLMAAVHFPFVVAGTAAIAIFMAEDSGLDDGLFGDIEDNGNGMFTIFMFIFEIIFVVIMILLLLVALIAIIVMGLILLFFMCIVPLLIGLSLEGGRGTLWNRAAMQEKGFTSRSQYWFHP